MKRVTLHKMIDRPSSNHNMAATGQPTPSGGKRTLHLLLALGIGLLASSSWLQAQTTIYVDANTGVNINNDGSQDKPYKTVAAAITAASSGDSIILKSGTYAEALTIDKKLTIQGKDSTEAGSVITKPITVATTEPVVLSQLRISVSGDVSGVEYSNKADGGTISLKEVALYSPDSGLKINKETATNKYSVNIEDSHINAPKHYAMWVRGQATNEIKVKSSKLEGWCAIYASLGQPDITITDSYLYGTNSYGDKFTMNWETNAPSNGFATLILESTQNGKIQLEDTYVAALHTAESTQGQAVISFQIRYSTTSSYVRNVTGNTVTFKGTSYLYMDRGDVSNPVLAYSETKATDKDGEEHIGENNKIVLADGWKGSITYGVDNKKPSSVLYADKNNEYRNFFVPAAIKDLSKFTVATDSVNMEIETSGDFNAAVTALNAGPRKCSIQLAEAEYDFSNTLFTVNKNLTLSGTDTTKTILKGAITLSPDDSATDTTRIAIKGIKFDYAPQKVSGTDSCKPLIGIKGNVNLLVENCLFNNQTAGYGAYNTMLPAKQHQHVFYTAPNATGRLALKNSVVNLNANCQSCILVDGIMKDISLTNVKVNGNTEEGSCQYGVYIFHEKTPVTLDNTTILLNNHYCIYAKYAGNQTITVKNKSLLSGYGAIYSFGSENMIINVLGGSTLTGITKNNGPSDSFGALILQASNNKVTIEDSYIGNEFRAKQTASMTPILFNSNPYKSDGKDKYAQNNTITIKGRSIIRTLKSQTNPTLVSYGQDLAEDNNTIIIEGNQIQLKDQDDKDCIIINKPEGAFRNASATILATIDFGELYDTVYYHEPIAHAGDMIMATDTTVDKTLRSLNAAKDNFFQKPNTAKTWEAYTIPDNIVFHCKDGYLVTGETAAKEFANSISDKPVFYLKQTATKFSTVAVGDNRVKVPTSTTWNNANNANRSVEIADNATLTINVDMALDTVFMAETAQLKTSANVTARAVQLTYNVAKSWKAFGFPYTIGTVKDVEGTKDIQTVAKENDGIWTANIKATAPIFEVSSQNTRPAATCIIAANANSKIVVTSSGSISLTSKAEPEAPVIPEAANLVMKSGTEHFKMVANPNTYDIQLTQTAYILSSDGTTFERKDNPTIKAFQSFVLADKQTTSTLRSLRVDETPTGNEITPVAGYYVQTGKGTITVHTAAPVLVTVVYILLNFYFNDRVSGDYQIAVPAGIYVVNRQKVIVK